MKNHKIDTNLQLHHIKISVEMCSGILIAITLRQKLCLKVFSNM